MKLKALLLISLIIIIMLFNFFGKENKGTEQDFWNWFTANQNEIYNIKTGEESVTKDLLKQLNKLDDNLVWSMSATSTNNKRDFIISAGGIKSTFPEVIKLVNSAPKELTRWNIIAFSPKRETDSLSYGDRTLDIKDIYFSSEKYNEKYDVNIYIRNYQGLADDNIIYLFLDSILGEYDTEMKLARIKIQDLDEKNLQNLTPLKDLDKVVK